MGRRRFIGKFREQIEFLKTSCRAYDAGNESEAIRIAVSLRVLFQQTAQSTSLMKHLDMTRCQMLSSPPVALADWASFVRIKLDLTSAHPVHAEPLLADKFEVVPLHHWWDGRLVYTFEGREYRRRHLVLAAANQDGGAHVDAKVERFYEDIASGIKSLGLNAQNLQYSGRCPFDKTQTQYSRNLHRAMLRQFGHEVLASERHFRWLRSLAA